MRASGAAPPPDGAPHPAPSGTPSSLRRAAAGGRASRTSFEDELARASATLMRQSRGEPLPAPEARRFEKGLGAPFRDVRVHTDEAADGAAQAVGARAVTTGRDIYFARGQYEPGTPAGDRLLAHELTHVTQERASTPASGPRVSQPSDETEREAARAESVPVPAAAPHSAVAPAPPAAPHLSPAPPAAHGGGILHRQVTEIRSLILGPLGSRAYGAYRAYAAREEVVELQGRPNFGPSNDLADWIRARSAGGLMADLLNISPGPVNVNVRFGNLGIARIPIYVDERGQYQSDGVSTMSLNIGELGHEDPSVSPLLLFGVRDNRVVGVFGGVTDDVAAGNNHEAIFRAILSEGARRLMEWRGVEGVDISSSLLGVLSGGHLNLPATPFNFDLAGTFTGSGTFGVHDGTVTFDATAALHVPGLDDATLSLARDSEGNLSGAARMAVRLGGFDGSLLASFGRGVLDIRGTATYRREGFEGTVTLLVTDEASAWRAVNEQLTNWPSPGGLSAATPLGPTRGDQPAAPSAERHVVAGWGVVEFRYKDWLHGRAQVIVDPDGDITSLGRVQVPRDIQFMEMREFARRRLAEFDKSVRVAGAWGIASVRVGAEGSVHGRAYLGPGYLRDLHAAGAFSTKRGFENHLTIGGTLEMRAGATLEINLTGYIRAYVQVPVVGDATSAARMRVAGVRLSLRGVGDISAYATAEASIHRTAPSGSGEADYSISGTLAAGGTMSFMLSGPELTLEIPFHEVRLFSFPDKHYTIGSLHGSASFRNFKIGGARAPALGLRPTGVGDGVRSLCRSIIDDGHGFRERPDLDDETATWTPSEPGDTVGPEGQEPDPPVIPSDPHFGVPTTPPHAPPAARQGPAPAPGGDADQPPEGTDAAVEGPDAGAGAGGADAGAPPDAGAPHDAGVRIAGAGPEPQPEAPPEPAEQGPDRNVEVPFDMEGTPHELILTPGPVLLMASAPGRLVLKLQRKREEVNRIVMGDPIRGRHYENQRDVLDELIREAQAVEDEAARLGFGERYAGTVPGLRPLADRLHLLARQFGWHDIVALLPTEPSFTPEPGEAMPPPAAQQVLNLPHQEFLNRIDAMPAAEALPLLREQRRYYNQEITDINTYINTGPTRESVRPMEARRTELLFRIGQIDGRIARLRDVVRPDGRPDLPCFAPDTPVHTPEGARPIGSLREGDAVLTWEAGRDLPVVGRVLAVHRKMTLQFFAVSVEGVTVRATARHPFWVVERAAWVAASELEPGQHVRMLDGRAAPVESVTPEQAEGAPTVDLSITPYPTYFVGAGVLVHNTPPLRSYSARWRRADGTSVPGGPFKIYLGHNTTSTEWDNCIYVGQTKQSRAKRESDHQAEARLWLDGHPHVPDNDDDKRYYRFKLNMHIDLIAEGLLANTEDADKSVQADWLEQENIDYERRLRGETRGTNYSSRKVMNRREQLRTSKQAIRGRLVNDPIVRASGFC